MDRNCTRPPIALTALVGLVLLFVPDYACGQESTSNPNGADNDTHVARLVAQLGDEKFAVREQAEAELTRLGLTAEKRLEEAIQHSDLELRLRARRTLETIQAADFERRLNLFVESGDVTYAAKLPGWKAFRLRVGSDRKCRELFAQMQRQNRELLAVLEARPQRIPQALKDIFGEQDANPFSHTLPQAVEEGGLAVILFIASDPSVTLDDDTASEVYTTLMVSELGSAMRGANAEQFRKLLGAWISREGCAECDTQRFWLAAQYQIKEGAHRAIKVLEGGGGFGAGGFKDEMYYALLLLGRVGDKEHLPVLEQYFKTQRVVDQLTHVERDVDVQLRDAALAAAVRVTGQKTEDYGFFSDGVTEWGFQRFGFANRSDRAKAFKKWQEWKAAEEKGRKGDAEKGK